MNTPSAPSSPENSVTLPTPPPTKQRVVLGAAIGLVLLVLVVLLARTLPAAPTPSQPPSITPALDPVSAINAAFNNNDFAATIAHAQTLLQSDSSDLRARLFLAAAWAQRGTIEYKEVEYGDTAIALANQVLAEDASQVEAYRVIGYAQETRQDFDAAIASYNQILKEFPNDHVTLNNRGHAYDLAGDLTRAKADFEQALTLQPDYAPALQNMGRVRIRENDYPGAKEFFTQVVETGENQRLRAEALGGLSTIALYYDADQAQALQLAQQAVAADPAFVYGHVAQARIHISQEQWAEATTSLEQALTRYPDLAAAHEWLGIAYAKTGQFSEAIAAFQQGRAATATDIHLMASERTPLAARFDYYLAATYAAQEDGTNALAHLKQAITNAQGDVITTSMIMASIQHGSEGFFAKLVGVPEYDALVEALGDDFLAPAQGISVISLPNQSMSNQATAGNLIPAAQAAVINLNPHGAHGLAFDEYITGLLRSYVRGEISLDRLRQLCETAVVQASGGTQHCVIQGNLQTGILIGCTNAMIAQYIPPQPPTARIQTQEACLDKPVTANGTGSSDPDGTIASYAWSVRDPLGNPVTVAATAASITFPGTLEGNYGISLTVRDNENLSHTVTTSPRVYNNPPVAVISTEGTVARQPVRLDGSASYDPDAAACGDTIKSYAWSVTDPAGNAVSLGSGATQAQATFTPSQPGAYQVRLTVTDNHDKPGTATATAQIGAPVFSPGPLQEVE